MSAPLLFTDVDLIRTLTQTRANIYLTAQALKVTRGAVQKRIKSNPEIQELANDLKEGRKDIAEGALDSAVLRGEGWAVCFFLKTQAKDRGYIERNEVSVLHEQLKNIEAELNARLAANSGEDSQIEESSGDRTTGSAGV